MRWFVCWLLHFAVYEVWCLVSGVILLCLLILMASRNVVIVDIAVLQAFVAVGDAGFCILKFVIVAIQVEGNRRRFACS